MRTIRAVLAPWVLAMAAVWLAGCASSSSPSGTLPPVEDLGSGVIPSTAASERPPAGVEVGSIEKGPEFVAEPAEVTEPDANDRQTPTFETAEAGNNTPAVAALLDSAGRHADAGELDKAAAALERALRIDPRNAGVWHDLGEVRFYQSEYQQSEALAKRSNSLVGGNRELRVSNWELIERSRRARGDTAGADAAAAQARNP